MMKFFRATVLLCLVSSVLASVSNINLSPTGFYAPVSTQTGLYVTVTILIYMLFSELGYIPFKFQGKKKRSVIPQLRNGNIFADRSTVLKMIRALDPQDCLLRFLCELEAYKNDAEINHYTLDPDLKSLTILLNVAKRNEHPAIMLRENPGSPELPFEIAIHTGMEGLHSCIQTFNSCPYNVTTMQALLGQNFIKGISVNTFV